MRVRLSSVIAIMLAAASLALSAQDKPAPPAQSADKAQPAAPARQAVPPVPLKVTVVLSRYQGEKRISSMPYAMGVTAKEARFASKATLRMGVDVPVVQTVFGGGGAGAVIPQSSYNYKSIGTNIDCTASFEETIPGMFQLGLTVSDTSVGLGTVPKDAGKAVLPDVPNFRSFNSSFTALLRDGQTMQYTSATDPVTGEVMKIDVTLNLMK